MLLSFIVEFIFDTLHEVIVLETSSLMKRRLLHRGCILHDHVPWKVVNLFILKPLLVILRWSHVAPSAAEASPDRLLVRRWLSLLESIVSEHRPVLLTEPLLKVLH